MNTVPIKTSGKWILCGEHAVLRGSLALAFPIDSQYFSLEYRSDSHPLTFECKDGRDLPHLKPFVSALEKGFEIIKRKSTDLKGTIQIDANIPLGAGLGGSASLCVAVGKLFCEIGFLPDDQLFSFSQSLENIFHGQSSGVDVAVVIARKGISFFRGGEFTPIEMSWQPNWYLLHSGIYSKTAEDIKKVQRFISANAKAGQALDDIINESSHNCLKALRDNEVSGLKLLSQSIDNAANCFSEWELIPEAMRNKMEALREAGALAVKPTGSGGGGFILSLWPAKFTPPKHFNLLPINEMRL